MIKQLKRFTSLMLTICMLLSMSITTSFASDVSTGITVSTQMSEVAQSSAGKQIYKLVFSAKSPYGISVLSTIFSYDNSVIVPVDKSQYTDFEINDLKVNIANTVNIKLSDTNSDLYTAPARSGYNVGNRTGIHVDISSAAPITSMDSEQEIFEFYFRLADDKTTDDLTKGSFRIETDKSEGSILAAIYDEGTLPIVAGIRLTDKNPDGDVINKYTKGEDNQIALNLAYTNSDVQKLGSIELGTVDGVTVTKEDQTTSAPTVTSLDTEGDAMAEQPSVTWSYEPTDAPTGVTYSDDGTITVNKDAQTQDIKIIATAEGISGETTVSITRPAPEVTNVAIVDGAEELTVPVDGASENATTTFNATVTDQFDTEIQDANVTWSISPETTGVSIENGTVTVTNAAKEAITDTTGTEFTVTATAADGVEDTATITIKRAASEAKIVEIYRDGSETPLSATDTVVKPVGDEPTTHTYTAKVFDQYGADITASSPATLALGEPSVTGVTFENGTLTVTKDATTGNVTLTATVTGASSVTKDITINITELTVDWEDVQVNSEITYGTTNADAVTLPSSGTASDNLATVTGTFAVVDGDTIQDVGEDKTITVKFTVNADSESYAGVEITKTYTVKVNPKSITAAVGDYSITKVYDKETTAGTATGSLTLEGVVADDNVSATIETAPTYTNANAGNYDLEANVTLTGDDATNYTLASNKITVPATITKATITSINPTEVADVYVLASEVNNIDDVKGKIATKNVTASFGTDLTEEIAITWTTSDTFVAGTDKTYTFTGSVISDNFNTYDATLTAKVIVSVKYPVTVTVNTPADITYGETLASVTASQEEINNGTDVDGTFTYLYEGTTLAGTAYSSDKAPTQAGTYTVTATLVSDTHAGSAKSEEFTISPKQLTVNVNDYSITKVYDKTTTAGTATSSLTLSDVVSGDEDKVSAIIETVPVYTNANAGDYELEATVTLTGDAASNYTLASNTITVPATITKAEIAEGTKPVITGTAKVGETLTATVTGIDSDEFTYQWYRQAIASEEDGDVKEAAAPIADATNSTYELTHLDSNKEVYVVATVKADGNYTSSDAALQSDPVAVEKMAITGTITLEVEKAEPTPEPTEPEEGGEAGESEAATLTETDGEVTNGESEDETPVEPEVNPNAIAAGDTIKATANIENDIAVKYQWIVNGEAVTEPSTAYTVKQGDITIYVLVIPVSDDYIGEVQSTTLEVGKVLLTGKLNITGENTVDSQLTATLTGDLTYGTDYTLVWLRDSIQIATSETYTITKNDKGHAITVKAVAAGTYTGEVLSENNISVAATAPDAPVVTATAGNGQVTLNWTKPHDGGSPITGYILKYNEANIEISANETTYTVTGLTNGTEYTFNLVAENNVGEGAESTVKSTPIAPSTGGGSSSGGSSSGGSTTGSVSNPSTSGGVTTVTTTPSTSVSGNTAKAEVTTSTMDKTVTNAIEAAKENNTKPVVKINIDNKTADNLEVTLPTSALTDLAETVNGELTISSDIATVTVDSVALENILSDAGSKVTLNVKTVEKYELNSRQQAVVGDSPVFDFSLVSGNDTISNFGGGTVTISIPYTLPYNLDADKVIVYYVDDMGNISACDTIYNVNTKIVTFNTNHFSKYFIGYDNSIDMTAFSDVDENRWSAQYIYDLYNRDIVDGVGNGLFAPEKNITRAEFVKILAGVAGATSSDLTGTTNFTDVSSNSWYASYVAWAVNNGVTSGTSDTTFSPNANITREQMATMIYRFASSKGIKLPETETAVNFADAMTFSDWAVDAISAMQKAGIISGMGNNNFAPSNNATREQACKMLSVLLAIIEG